jgi:mycothiol synthase
VNTVDTVALPAGYSSRAPEPADAERILELIAAYNTAIIGFADSTLDDVMDELTEPGFDPATDGWLVFDEKGRLAGYGWAMGSGSDSDLVDADVIAPDAAVTRWLLDRALTRAAELGRSRGHRRVTVDKGIYRGDQNLTALATELGFQPGTTFHRMRIDHTGPAPMPEPPDGVVVHEGAYDDAIRRAAHHVSIASFADHFGHTDTPYDKWLEAHEARSTFDWSQMVVLEAEGKQMAVCECTDQFVEDDNCGYVLRLGVLEQARGRGLAKYLLRRAFAVDAAAGRSGTILHVDTNNTTPALGLYESVGMRPILVIDVWRKTLPT